MLRRCFATELGELLDEDQLILQTAITQNVKTQKRGVECRVAYKECGRIQLGLHKTLVYILYISKAGLFWSLSTY